MHTNKHESDETDFILFMFIGVHFWFQSQVLVSDDEEPIDLVADHGSCLLETTTVCRLCQRETLKII